MKAVSTAKAKKKTPVPTKNNLANFFFGSGSARSLYAKNHSQKMTGTKTVARKRVITKTHTSKRAYFS